MNKPTCLIIMDGFGLASAGPGNAIASANTPNLDKIFAEHKMCKLQASGEAVGLPAGQMGNSEVGHLNIGAGRVVYQELTRINKACQDGSILNNEVAKAFYGVVFEKIKAYNAVSILNGQRHKYVEHILIFI